MAEPLANLPPVIIVKKRRKTTHGGHHGSGPSRQRLEGRLCRFCHRDDGILHAAMADLGRRPGPEKGLSDYFSLATDESAPASKDQSKPGAGPQARPASSMSLAMGRSASGEGRMGSLAQIPASTLTLQAEELRLALEQLPDVKKLRDNLVVRQTPDGVRIELVDAARHSMFQPGTASPTAEARLLLATVARRLGPGETRLAIEGHTDADGGLSDGNWVLSGERGQAARRILVAAGVAGDRIAEVTGVASTKPATPDVPDRAENRRISLRLIAEPPAMPAELGVTRR